VLTQSQVIALRRLGYTYLYTDRGLDPMVRLYRVFAPLVRAVVVDAPDAHACFRDPYCALRREWPWGIPVWKILSFHYWDYVRAPSETILLWLILIHSRARRTTRWDASGR
jgi:hypothetical protein